MAANTIQFLFKYTHINCNYCTAPIFELTIHKRINSLIITQHWNKNYNLALATSSSKVLILRNVFIKC